MFLFVQRSSALLLSTATCIHASIYADAHYQVIEEARRPWLLTRETCAVSLFFPGKGEISNRRLSSCGRATVEVWIHIYTLWYDIMIFFSFLSHSSAAAFMADETERKSFCFIRVVHSERRPALFPFFLFLTRVSVPGSWRPHFFLFLSRSGLHPEIVFFFSLGVMQPDDRRKIQCGICVVVGDFLCILVFRKKRWKNPDGWISCLWLFDGAIEWEADLGLPLQLVFLFPRWHTSAFVSHLSNR